MPMSSHSPSLHHTTAPVNHYLPSIFMDKSSGLFSAFLCRHSPPFSPFGGQREPAET